MRYGGWEEMVAGSDNQSFSGSCLSLRMSSTSNHPRADQPRRRRRNSRQRSSLLNSIPALAWTLAALLSAGILGSQPMISSAAAAAWTRNGCCFGVSHRRRRRPVGWKSQHHSPYQQQRQQRESSFFGDQHPGVEINKQRSWFHQHQTHAAISPIFSSANSNPNNNSKNDNNGEQNTERFRAVRSKRPTRSMGDGETEATSSPFLPAASKPKTKAPETNSNHQQSSKKYNSDENDNTDDSSSFSYHSALAIVPPDEAWDRIQRARHEAQDASYATWPPAIRLFHPFAVEEDNSGRVALEIAALIEEYSLASFTITLSEWSIVPHQEAMEVALSGTLKATTATKRDEYSRRRPGSEEDRKTQELIANEERIGKEKLLYRQAQKRKKLAQEQLELGRDAEDGESTGYDASNDDNSMESQSVPIWEEFNGPCVICLEPDPDSRDRIQALRYLLKHRLAGAKAYADLYSPTGSMLLSTTTTVSTKNARRPSSRQRMSGGFQSSSERSNDDPAAFRPVVPIASFPTVASAIGVARKLRKGWEPLTFNVTDLHSMSSQVGRRVGIGERNGDSHKRMTITEEPDLDISEEDLASQSTETFGISSQFGCDAMIYFMGEEVEMDPELNQELANMVFENGEEGGYNRGLNEQSSAKGRNSGDTVDKQPNMRKKEVSVSETFEKWLLEDDEEYDQGYVVVIGRTQFFTGEMRQYIGMPASSPYDSV